MLLVVFMLFSMMPQAAFATEVSEELQEYAYNYEYVVVGANSVTLDPTAETTIFLFEPTEEGTYSFAADTATVSYWGASEWYLFNSGETQWECTGVGQTAYIGRGCLCR